MPDSQESVLSSVSSNFSVPALPSSSSNISTSTVTDTDLTSPASTHVYSGLSRPTEKPTEISSSQSYGANARFNAARIDTVAANAQRTGDTAASPMSICSPAFQGTKRTADGSLKAVGPATVTPAGRVFAHKRNKSMDTHSGTRIGELSAQLKTRLSYAMVKVQNGWEKQSLDELEEAHSQHGSPNSASGGSRPTFGSPSSTNYQRRPSGVSENSDQILMSPGSDPSRSHATTPFSYWHPGTKPAMNAAVNLINVTSTYPGRGLAPAPDFDTGRRRRANTTNTMPSLPGTGHRKYFSDLGAVSRAPVTPRAGILRMPSQQAEKDAVDTLLFMSSPNNSQRFPNTSSAAPSPLRAEAPQRRVMFEAYPSQEKRIVYQSSMPAPSQYQHQPYAANPAR
ncbi:hypothetical protein P153DRAFT_387338 [Dothidotthia symphoricarpi CBS 119687]|uniref:Cyclin-dependent kinase n=1 Tax=Dothidotthia symphoricarpi CBS 119687 TaxID=1392245 RepID=A0A6A6A7R3_9PLEO|nr:uncharacterized protein P153DRAFT_387338 [Dothidotthia symphoricarpi CBS 119687]KAF2127596.1 hypothetical protein P153DRAFT_387338 [Dothidotthia symphoricarpi CBS 119687]